MRNCSVIAYLQSFWMNGTATNLKLTKKKKKKNYKCNLVTHKGTNNHPHLQIIFFLYTRTKSRPTALELNEQQWSFYRVPSVKIQYSKRVLQQTEWKSNCMQTHLVTIYIITFIFNRIHIRNIQLSFWNTKWCIQSKTKETSKSLVIKGGRKKKPVLLS